MKEEKTYFADTSLLVDLVRGHDEAVAVHDRCEGGFITGSLCLYELRKVSDVDIDRFAPYTVVPFGTEDAREAGRIFRRLEQQGTKKGEMDVLIAAQAVTSADVIVTRDKDFMEIDAVECLYYGE